MTFSPYLLEFGPQTGKAYLDKRHRQHCDCGADDCKRKRQIADQQDEATAEFIRAAIGVDEPEARS